MSTVVEYLEAAAKGAVAGEILAHCTPALRKIFTDLNPIRIFVVRALDPNDKVGAVGIGPARYVTGAEPLRYAIANFVATVTAGAPILVTEEGSTRALALVSAVWLRDPFPLDFPFLLGPDRRTRVMLFVMNFDFQPSEDLSIIKAEAEDAAHRIYPLTVEHVGRVPGFFWLNSIVIRLNDDMINLGDVLLRINVRGVSSNRVRLGIGHNGGGPPDDPGAAPAPGREP